MNKIFKLFVFISVLFVVVGLTSCAPTVNINTTTDPETLDITSAEQLKTFMTNNSTTGKLANDITIAETLELKDGKDKTLDLNGKTITSNVTGSSSKAFYINSANTKLTIKDSTNDKNGKFIATYADFGVYVGTGAKLILDSGNILAKATDVNAVYINSATSEFEMKGGKVYAATGFGNSDITKGTAVHVANGKASFTNGTLLGETGIWVSSDASVSKISGIHLYATEKGINNYGAIGSASVSDSGITGGDFDVTADMNNITIYGIFNYGSSAYIKMTGGYFTLSSAGHSGVTQKSIYNYSGSGIISDGTFEVTGTDSRNTTGLTVSNSVDFD